MQGGAWLLMAVVGALAGQAQQRTEPPEKGQLRERLLQQFNAILETRGTARGLVVTVDDRQFGDGGATLTPGGREKLARAAGILLAYPGLQVALEGRADGASGTERDLKLSAARAAAVRDYLLIQGVPAQSVIAAGRGREDPAAPGAESGRTKPRVDMVVSGEPIG